MSFDLLIAGVNPIQIPTIYETCVAGGVISPGVCEVSGFSRSWDWDVQKAKGKSGASTTLQGEALASGQIKFKLWRPEHFIAWAEFADILVRGNKQKQVEAIDILHPALQELDIFSLVVTEMGQQVNEGKGLFSYTVKLQEFRKPKPAGGSPKGSKGGGKWTEDKAQSAQDKELEELLKQAAAA